MAAKGAAVCLVTSVSWVVDWSACGGCAENEQWVNKGKRRESSSLSKVSAPAICPLMAKGAQGVAPTPGAKKRKPRTVGVVPRENFLNFERMGRGVVRLVLSLFLAPKTSPATWENLCSAKNCSGLSVEILNILNSPKKGADSDLCARSARTRDRKTGQTWARVAGGAMANDYSGKLMFGAPCGSRAEKDVRGGRAGKL